MELEKIIMARVKELPMEKRRKVLQYVESIKISDKNDGAEANLAADELQAIWKEWAASGPQGPIEDDGAPEFP